MSVVVGKELFLTPYRYCYLAPPTFLTVHQVELFPSSGSLRSTVSASRLTLLILETFQKDGFLQ